MELRQLRYFCAIARCGSFSKAAGEVFIAQSALSHQLAQLEEELGTPLFHRTRRGVELTDAGRVLYEDARGILAQAERAAERTHKAAQGLLGRVDVAIFGSGIFGVIPQLLRRFREACPEVSIVLHSLDKEAQIDALHHRRITVAFNRLMRPVEGLTCETLLTEPIWVAVPSGTALAARTAITMQELRDQPLVLFPTGSRPSFIDRVHEMCRGAGFTPQVAQEVGDVVHAVTLVGTGFGACLVSRSAANMNMPGVTFRPLHHPTQDRIDLCCIYREDDDSELKQAFLRSMREGARLLGDLP